MAPGTALVQKRHGGDGITHRHRRRSGHGRGRFRLLPGLEHPAGQRAAGADDRHEQRLGHLHAGVQPARRDAHHRPRQGVRHSRRGGGRQRPHRQLARHPPGDGLLPPGAPAVHAGGARCRGCTATRRPAAPCASRASRTPSTLFEQKLLDAGVLEPSSHRSGPRGRLRRGRKRRWSRRLASRCRQPADVRNTPTRPARSMRSTRRITRGCRVTVRAGSVSDGAKPCRRLTLPARKLSLLSEESYGHARSSRSPGAALRRGTPRRHRHLRRGRRPAAGRRLHRHAGA